MGWLTVLKSMVFGYGDVRIQFTLPSKKVVRFAVLLLCLCVIHILVVQLSPTSAYDGRNSMQMVHPEVDTSRRRSPNDRKVILMWQPFNGYKFFDYEKIRMESCPYKCELIKDPEQIHRADAVNFHLTSLWTKIWTINTKATIKFPTYRRSDQIWMLTNQEPPPNLFGSMAVVNNLFNWTVWYRKDADVYYPYGLPVELTKEEMLSAQKNRSLTDVYRTKPLGITGKISNCKDVAKRYRLVQKLQKVLDIDMFGKCYNRVCGDPLDHSSCDNITSQYKFYLALENSRCKDYITEKYWSALERNQIPLVNWDNTHISNGVVIPNSYISMYDFPNFQEFADYVMKVANNETLYNSYFEWKKMYKVGFTCISCVTCKALHENRPPRETQDIDTWVKNDTCDKVGVINDIVNKVDKFLFSNLGI